jgi:hypothetical protein
MQMVDLTKIFGEFGFEAAPIDSKRDAPSLIYPTVPKKDNEPVAIIEPDLKRGPWIAGGAALRWYQGQTVGANDIDVFCRDSLQTQEVIDRIKSYGRFAVKYESDNAVTLDYWDRSTNERWTIQIIRRRFFPNIQAVIDSFDITVCQIGTVGAEWFLGKNTARDIRERNLRFTGNLQPDAAKRLVKYWTYGYRPVDSVLDSVMNNPEGRWSFDHSEDYNNAF